MGDVDHVKQFHSYCKLYPADEPLWNMSNLYASLRDIHTYKKAISDFMDACHIRATGSKGIYALARVYSILVVWLHFISFRAIEGAYLNYNVQNEGMPIWR